MGVKWRFKILAKVNLYQFKVQIFFGVVYYQRLRHMIADKYQVRSTGSVDPVTLQPVKGRKKGGGVRFGEMERDTMIAHGAAFCLQDRLLYSSDLDYAMACARCGSIVSVSKVNHNRTFLNTLVISFSKSNLHNFRKCQRKIFLQPMIETLLFV